MEDFFQILIFIIFIVSSIISSRNKKKKKQQQKKNRTTTIPSNIPTATKSKQKTKQKTPEQILEELFGIKTKPTPPPPVVYKEETKVEDSVYETWNAEDDFNQTRHNDDYSYEAKDKKKKSLIEESKTAYKSFEKHSTPSKIKKPRKKTKLQKIFSNPSNLKEYIVINEVLGKPKALRR